MPDEGGFDFSVLPDTTANQIAASTDNLLEPLTKARQLQEYDVTGFDEVQAIRGKVRFPGKIDDLTFDPARMMVGVIGANFAEGKKDNVEVSYPHIRSKQLVGKTKLRMTLDEAFAVLEKCGEVLELSPEIVRAAVIDFAMFTRMEDRMRLMDGNIALALHEKYREKVTKT